MNSKKKINFFREEFKDRVESQDELHGLLEKCFAGIEKMDFNVFNATVEKLSSDIVLFVKIFFNIFRFWFFYSRKNRFQKKL